jgi:hypothetical protein
VRFSFFVSCRSLNLRREFSVRVLRLGNLILLFLLLLLLLSAVDDAIAEPIYGVLLL